MPLINPVPNFNFNVIMLDAKPLGDISFSDAIPVASGAAKAFVFGNFAQADGLNAEMETEEYREGGHNTGPHVLVKWGKYPNLIFRRGVTPNPDIWDWYYATLYSPKDPVRKNGLVVLNDRGTGITQAAGGPELGLPILNRLPIAVWMFRNGLPAKLQGPSLNAKSNEIAIEALEIAHEGLYRLGPGMLPGVAGDIANVVGI
jgi:phage tail-like protein